MDFTPILPTDMKGNIDAHLLHLAEEVCIKSAMLKGTHNTQIIYALKELLRKTNSYYSNKIESEGTHPLDIDRAMKQEFFANKKEKDLQLLSLAHIEVQKYVENYCEDFSHSPFSREFILSIHKEFYSKDGMEVFLNVTNKDETLKMIPGELRDRDVAIRNHIAPEASKLTGLMNAFENLYKIPESSTQALKLIYAISSHHRLTWIHPFLDGNGRVSRLLLDGVFKSIDLDGYGLWNISRGLARDSQEYKKQLAFADMPIQGSTDGRGPLSVRGLTYYIEFMLSSALDQIEYMSKHLQLSSLGSKIEKYVTLSQQGLLDTQSLPDYSTHLFKELLISGELARGKVKTVIGKQDRTATSLIKKLIEIDDALILEELKKHKETKKIKVTA